MALLAKGSPLIVNSAIFGMEASVDIKVEVLRPFWFERKMYVAGDTVTIPKNMYIELLAIKKVIQIIEPPVEELQPETVVPVAEAVAPIIEDVPAVEVSHKRKRGGRKHAK